MKVGNSSTKIFSKYTRFVLFITSVFIFLNSPFDAVARDIPTQYGISTANPLASSAGLEILRAGGSAIDAAIAAQSVLTLVEPQSSGIGGGAFMLHFNKRDKKIEAYDGRETAPSSIKSDIFLDSDGKPRKFRDVSTGGIAVGVPGLLKMLEIAHRDHGRLPWAQLFVTAIGLSETGFKVSRRLHQMLAKTSDLKTFPDTRAYFFNENGIPLPVGHLLQNRPLAAVLKRVAKDGTGAFYNGGTAQNIVAATRNASQNPGLITLLDIQKYEVKKREVLCRAYRKWNVCGMPPPTSGGITLLQILGILQNFSLPKLNPGSIEAIHLISEASRLAYADRKKFIGDPDFVAVPVEKLLDRNYLKSRAKQISLSRSMGIAKPGTLKTPNRTSFSPRNTKEFSSTTHLSIIDLYGNAVAMTSSIERAFGSRLMVDGFILNNQLTDFAFLPAHEGETVANAVAPNKRPRSSMAPTMVFDHLGNLRITVGSPGGSRIIGYVAQTLIGILDWNLDMQAAIDLPRHVNRNSATELEKGTSLERLIPALKLMGHKARTRALTSGLQGIRVSKKGLDGGADRRREGIFLGD